MRKWRSGPTVAALLASLALGGCSTKGTEPHYVDYEKEGTATHVTMALSREDFDRAALKLVDSILRSPEFKSEGKERFVLMIGDFVNDTTQRIDIDQLVKKIRIALLRSGRFVVTTAVRSGGPEDSAAYEVRKLREHPEFKKSTVAKKGELIAPKYSLSGKIIQRVSKLHNGDERVDYYIQMSITDIESGLAYWEGEEIISKEGSGKSAPW